MARNIEIKARLTPEHLAFIRREAVSRASTPPEYWVQVDTFFCTPRGRLKLRVMEDGTAELIAYDRADQAGSKCSSYVRSPCVDPESLHAALARSLGVRETVRKRRQVIVIGQTRVHLDEVESLGTFLELEVVLRDDQTLAEGEAIARQLMQLFRIDSDSLIEGAYVDLIER